MQNNTYGARADVYLRTLVTKLEAIYSCPAYFDEATSEEWAYCIQDFDDILSSINRLDEIQDKCYDRFVESLGENDE